MTFDNIGMKIFWCPKNIIIHSIRGQDTHQNHGHDDRPCHHGHLWSKSSFGLCISSPISYERLQKKKSRVVHEEKQLFLGKKPLRLLLNSLSSFVDKPSCVKLHLSWGSLGCFESGTVWEVPEHVVGNTGRRMIYHSSTDCENCLWLMKKRRRNSNPPGVNSDTMTHCSLS